MYFINLVFFICQLVPNDTKVGLNAARMMISVCQFTVWFSDSNFHVTCRKWITSKTKEQKIT